MKSAVKLMLLIICCTATAGHAALLTLNPSDSGLFNREVLFSTISVSFENAQDPLTVISNDYGHPAFGFVQSAAYLIFDLQTLPFIADTATLNFNFATNFGEQANLNTYSLDMISASNLAALTPGQSVGAEGQTIYDDLTGGPMLAPTQVGEAGELSYSLNAEALAQINSANGLWGFGLKAGLPAASVPIAGLHLVESPELVLTGRTVVPTPTTLLLSALGLLLLVRSQLRGAVQGLR